MTEKIRNRLSYSAFKELYRFLCNKSSVEDIVRWVFEMMDARCCFGSIKNAAYAKESVELVLKDGKNGFGGSPTNDPAVD